MKLQKKEEVTLDVDTRLRILFQITSAVDFLHTPVKNFRGAIIHMDIKALNIVLDKCNNARLIDFGLAREMREGHDSVKTTMKQLPHTPGHFKTIRHAMLTKYADCHNLGGIWKNDKKQPFEVAKDLAGLSAKCLKDEQLTSTNILREIK
ncbi:uncharacterized protein LOC128553223, partial [Mercenaria mercenaria]|uniref:uncharacterized protein LOC128553223 n=1 Tax=Mercenaria mercenaria TaxID=6596 RepID=UPI00234F09A1